MEINIFSRNELDAILRALRQIARANDRFTDAERALIEGVARIHEVTLDAGDLRPISLEEVAGAITDPHRRKRAVQLAIVMALVEGTPPPPTERAVRALAGALGVDDTGVQVLTEMTNGHALMARVDMFRRFGRFMRGVKGFPSVFGFFAAGILGLGGRDRAMAARYHALGDCAPGTFGRAFHDHFTENGFKFPGERGGVPVVFHDVGHVLAGYATDPQGEIQQAAFQAGFARRDGFTFLLFGILQFHIGMRITPIAKGYRGLFDVSLVIEALRRGAACRVDFSEGFDVFAHKDRSLDELRADLGIPPLATRWEPLRTATATSAQLRLRR
jgi:hypothetical protein